MTVHSGNLWVAEGKDGPGSFAAGSRVNQFIGNELTSQLNESETMQVDGLKHGVAIGVATGKPLIYVGAENNAGGLVAVFEAAGNLLNKWTGGNTRLGTFGPNIAGVAVDGSHASGDWAANDVYVSTGQNVIDIFKPEARGGARWIGEIKGTSPPGEPFLGETPEQDFASLSGITVDDANGDLLVIDKRSNPVIDILEPTGIVGEYRLVNQLTSLPSGPFEAIGTAAIDSVSGNIYVTNETTQAIDEFSKEGKFLGAIMGTPAGSFGNLQGLAVDPVSGNVYVGSRFTESGEIDVFGPDVIVPDVTTGPAMTVTATTATVTGAVNPDGAGPASCAFLWGETQALEHTAKCINATVTGSSAAPVESEMLRGLEPDTTYYYRLEATNHNGTNVGSVDEFVTGGPGQRGAWTTNVTATAAQLDAAIDPHGAVTYYYFEFGPTTTYGADMPAVTPEAPLGAFLGAGGTVSVSQGISGLAPGTEYHYRAIAISSIGGTWEKFAGLDEVFTTQAGTEKNGLPDSRGWELVSPPDKRGALISPIAEAGLSQAASIGTAFTFMTNAPPEANPEGDADIRSQNYAVRSEGGWTSVDIATPHSQSPGVVLGAGYEYRFFSTDLSEAIVEPFGPFTPLTGKEQPPTAAEPTVYQRTDSACMQNAADCYTALVTSTDANSVSSKHSVRFVGASASAQSVALLAPEALTSKAGDVGGLYEWAGGDLYPVSVRPRDEGGPTVGGTLGYKNSDTRDAVSSDGARIAWGLEGGGGEKRLYMWSRSEAESLRVDQPGKGASGVGLPEAEFQAASSDMSSVFFTDTQVLASGAHGRELYVCNVSETMSGLACTLEALAGNITGIVTGVSEDGSYVYFVAGTDLYMDHRVGGAWSGPRLIAPLSASDSPDWGGQGVQSLAELTVRVSPNGEFVAFMSDLALTGYDNNDAVSGVPDEEVFVYDAASGMLVCASCNPSGARPLGTATGVLGEEKMFEGFDVWPNGTAIAGSVPGWTPYERQGSLYQSRYLENSGRLFFDSSDALVPGDVNGVMDVYEWEPVGVGGCVENDSGYIVSEGACIGLISSGRSGEESVFLDASASGGDVFFLTGERLTTADDDNSLDVYDAHECTAVSPCIAALPSPAPGCLSGDSCKAGPTSQPDVFGAPPSVTFSGAGNVAPVKGVVKKPTRAQVLAAALKACAMRPKRKRAACIALARKRYGPVKTKRKTKAKKATMAVGGVVGQRGSVG